MFMDVEINDLVLSNTRSWTRRNAAKGKNVPGLVPRVSPLVLQERKKQIKMWVQERRLDDNGVGILCERPLWGSTRKCDWASNILNTAGVSVQASQVELIGWRRCLLDEATCS